MKAVLLTLIIAAQFVAPPPPPSPPPQRGQAPNPTNAPAPLNAAECKCSIELFVKRPNGEAISDVDITVTMAPVASRLQADANGQPQIIQAPAPAAGTTPATLNATTDSSGRAMFRDLAEGNYTVLARRDGYFGIANDTFPVQATARVPVGPAAATAVAGATTAARGGVAPARQPVQQITINMVQGATITGRILDGNRRPASAIQIGAYRVGYQLGHRVLTQVGTAVQSDDRGEYRLFWYPPGEYYIHTGAARAAFATNGGSSYPNVTYYPGTQDSRSAAPLMVGEGSALSGIDIAMPATSGVTISGTIVNTIPTSGVGPRGQPISRSVSSVFLVPRNAPFFENPALIPNIAGASLAARGGNAVNNNETSFEIRGVPPGTYDFYPVFNDGSPVAGGNFPGYYFARTPIEVASENVTGVQSVIRPGANLKGHITITGNPPATASNRPVQPLTITNVRLQFQPRENLPSLVRGGLLTAITPDADGAFNLANLVEGQFSITGVTGTPPDTYVSEVLMDSRNVSDDGIINIAGNSQLNMEVTISRGGGSIQGTIQDTKHNPVAAVRITLIPDLPRRGNLLLYKTTMSTAMGTFTLNGVAPGSYKLFAWEQIPTGAEQDSDFMREYDLLGTSVNVTSGLSQTNIQITPIPTKH